MSRQGFGQRLSLLAALRNLVLGGAAVLAVLVATWVVVGRQLMMQVPDYRHDLEALLEARLGTGLEIGSLRGHMDGATPVFVLDDIEISATEGAAPLRAGRVELSVDVLPSLFQRTLRARQLVVRGIRLHLTRDPDGKIHFKGLDALGGGADAASGPPVERLLDFVYRQKRLVIEEASGVLELPELPALEVEELAAAIVSSGSGHHLALTAAVRDAPARLDLRFYMDGNPRRLADLDGRGYLRLQLRGLDPWLEALWPWPTRVSLPAGEVEAWVTLERGRPVNGTLAANLDSPVVTGAPFSTAARLDRVRLLAGLRAFDQGFSVTLSDLALVHQGVLHGFGPVAAAWNGRQGDELLWKAAARDLSLGKLRRLLLELPLEPARRERLALLEATELSGELDALTVHGGLRRVDHFALRFHDLASRADGKLPGLQGVGGWAVGDTGGGTVMLDSPALQLDLPLMFEAPMRLAARGPVRWRRKEGVVRVDTGWLTAANEDASGQAVASLSIEPDSIPRLSLVAGLHDGDAAAAAAYIPLRRLPETMADWLRGAFRGGRVEYGAVLYEGPVRIDPARQQDRTFQIGVAARGLDLHYLAGWPLAEDLTAEILIDGRVIRGRNISGTILGSRLEGATADIPPYRDGGQAELVIQSRVQGPASDLQTILQQTPLRDRLPAEIDAWRVNEGQVEGHLFLRAPLGPDAPPLVAMARGQVMEAVLANPERRLHIEAFSGPLTFSLAEGLQSPGFTARLWGEPVGGDIATLDGRTRVEFAGRVSVGALRDWLDAPWAEPVSGTFPYRASLMLPAGNAATRLEMKADMSPVTIAVPPPLGRAPGAPLEGHLVFEAGTAGEVSSFSVGSLLKGRVWWSDGSLDRGDIVIGDGEVSRPDGPGLFIHGAVPRLSAGAWSTFLGEADLSGGAPRTDTPEPFPVRGIALQVRDLDLFGMPQRAAELRVSPRDGGWDFAVSGQTLRGQLHMPADFALGGDTPLRVKVQKLVLDDRGTEGTVSGSFIDPLAVPTADVDVGGLVLDGADYGRWRFSVRPRKDGVEIEPLRGDLGVAQVVGRLSWTNQDGRQRSRFVGSVSSSDVARMLRLFGFDPLLESSSMRSTVNLAWPGSPMDLDYLALQGTASLETGESRFPKTDSRTSALRVLGIFNIATVSRRLRLDFTDLYRKGLSCDSIGGDFRFDGPLVTTRNLVIKSPSAEFRLSGELNMAARTLNHKMEVTLPVSSNLYVGCLAGPAACAGIFVVERLWGNNLEKMTTLGYRVTGSWDEPRVEEVQGMFERSK